MAVGICHNFLTKSLHLSVIEECIGVMHSLSTCFDSDLMIIMVVIYMLFIMYKVNNFIPFWHQ